MRELITIKGIQRACLYGLGVLGLLGPSPPAKSKSKSLLMRRSHCNIHAQAQGEAEIWLQHTGNLAPEGDGRLASHPGHFNPGKDPVPIVQKAGWASGPPLSLTVKINTETMYLAHL
jgi:hypothetical protein